MTTELVLTLATGTRRVVVALAVVLAVLVAALAAFDHAGETPRSMTTCLEDCGSDTSPAAARLVAEQEALGRSCDGATTRVDSVVVLEDADGDVSLTSVSEAVALVAAPGVRVLAYCG